MKDNVLRAALFGRYVKIEKQNGRGQTFVVPGFSEEPDRKIEFRTDDGLILELLKRIEALERGMKSKGKKT